VIESRELERRAGALGIGVQHVELDYVLQHMLAQIARTPGELALRGGTALARVYWPDHRISEDLDFVAGGLVDDLNHQLARAAANASEATGLELQLEHRGFRDDRSRTIIRWTESGVTGGELLIDAVRGQRISLPVIGRSLDVRYTDLAEAGRLQIPVLDLGEILANKWIMLDDRDEPRDLYDLWWALAREEVDFTIVAVAHKTMYGYPPSEGCIDRASRLESRWTERLEHQIRGLVAFEEALGAVRSHFEAWRSDSPRE
jgi:predicted nucleotidyltransferase component of viral defense system